MRTKYLRRFVAVVLTLVLTVMCLSSASAYELFRDSYAYKWFAATPGNVPISWLSGSIPASGAGVTSSALTSGTTYWRTGTADPDLTAHIHPTTVTLTNLPDYGWIIHSIPTQTFWDDYVNCGLGVTTYAFTLPYSTNDVVIIDGGVRGTHPMCGQNIAYAYIYYNPDGASFQNVNWVNVVAHEIGHAIGFGHVGKNETIASIMKETETNYTAIQDYDIEQVENKYS